MNGRPVFDAKAILAKTERVFTAAEGRRALATGKFPVDVPAGRVKGPRGMNKLEARFVQEVLEPWVKAGLAPGFGSGDIDRWHFEGITFKLAQRTRYTPDFFVAVDYGGGEQGFLCIETKGFWREDARVKIKVAAEMFPEFSFFGARRIKREWIYERFVASPERLSAE